MKIIPRANPKKRLLTGAFIALALIAGIVFMLEKMNITYIFHKRTPATSASPYTKGEPKTNKPTGNTNGSTVQSKDPKGDTTNGNTTATLIVPTGDFVSNHHPNLSGSPAPNSMTSVCTTSPGASCKITFTKDGVTKSLLSQTTDSGGSAYWNWKLQDIGLDAGTWKIQAVATLGTQTQTANDAMDLVVQP